VRVRRLRLAALVATALLALSLSACGGAKGIHVKAHFTDVGDLAPEAPVMMADVKVGTVDSIRLDHQLALVEMTLDPNAQVPAGVTARVRRTSLLGERIVDLQIPPGLSGSAPLLRDGQVIQHTLIRPDLEDLVRSGTDALAPIAASEVSTLVDEGAKGFGGQGDTLKALLLNFHDIVHAYAQRTDDIQSVIDSMNQLNTTLAAHADAQGRSIVNSERALRVLQEESGQLHKAIHALNELSIGARSILKAHADEMGRFFGQMRVILAVLNSEQKDLEGILQMAPFHNRNTQLVEFQDFNQVLQEFVICGLNDDPSDPARRCKG
jgi:phospholipid/cholesterol/gamma-HCH transport system substrate-binding protein